MSTFPQLSFQINNPDAPNTLYITGDPAVNQLSLVITTNTDGTVFTPGQAVPLSQASQGTGSLLYLDLTPLNLTGAQFSALTFTAAGWTFEEFTDAGQVVCMTPTSQVTLNSGAGNAVTVAIAGLVLPAPQPASAQLVVTTYRVNPVTAGNLGLPTNFKVLIQVPPDTHDQDLHAVLQLSVPQMNVVASISGYPQVSNSLSLLFSPGATPRKVLAGDATIFTVTFVYAGDAYGYGALATVAAGLNFSFTRGVNAAQWALTQGTNLQNPSWLLQVPSGQPVVGTGAQSTVEFLIGGIVTSFQAGPTLMLVSYTGVPGYQDGSYSILLEKVPHAAIRSFTATPNPTTLASGAAQVALSWTTSDAGTLTLMPGYHDVTGTSSFVASIPGTTAFTLQAQGTQLASAGNVAFANTTATVLPVINSFTAQPSAVYYKDFPRNVALAWNVNTNQNVRITSSVGPPDPNQYAPVGGVTRSVSQPQMLTLAPVGSGSAQLKRNLVLSGFQVLPASLAAPGPLGYVAASPNAAFVAATDASQPQLYLLDTLGYQQMGSPVSTGASPMGVAFSPDGSQIFVANSGDGTVSVFAVTATQSTPPYSASLSATLTAGGSPREVAVSPDGRFLYVTVNNGGQNTGSLVVFQRQTGGTYTQLTTIVTGLAPHGVAVAPSGAQVFVANTGSNTVLVIGVSSGGQHSVVNTFTNIGTAPVGLAVTPDAQMLLVACNGSNTVLGVSTQFSGTTSPASFPVGKNPQQVAVVPGGAYAFVTNNGDGTVSLLGYDSGTQTFRVLEKAIQAGSGPTGVAVSPDGGLALVANGGASTLAVLTLATYQQQGQPATVGNLPTSVAAAADGSRAAVWHDSTLSVPGKGTPGNGLWVYETASQTVTQQLQGSNLVDCVFSPAAGATTAYLTTSGATAITVIDATTYQPVTSVPVPAFSGLTRTPLRLAMSADGTRLFSLVSNGQRQYSLVVWEVDAGGGYTLLADLAVFTTAAQATLLMLAATPDGTRAFVADAVDGQLWVAVEDQSNGYAAQQTTVKLSSPSSLAVSPDGTRLYALNKGGMTNSITMVDTSTLQSSTSFLPEQVMFVSLNELAVSPDGARIFATDGISAGIRVLDAASLRFIQTITTQAQGPWGIAMVPDGSRIFTANVNSGNLGIIQQVQPSA